MLKLCSLTSLLRPTVLSSSELGLQQLAWTVTNAFRPQEPHLRNEVQDSASSTVSCSANRSSSQNPAMAPTSRSPTPCCLALRGFASSTSNSQPQPSNHKPTSSSVVQQLDNSTQPHSQATGTAWPHWDWAYVTGQKAGRKPAIKRPSRHQWLFCNPKYNPNDRLPPKILPPHAPITAQQQSEAEVFLRLKPAHKQRSNRRFKQEYNRWLALRDVDWRQAFFNGLAADTKAAAKAVRIEQERIRQHAWAEHKAALLQAEIKAAAGEGPVQ